MIFYIDKHFYIFEWAFKVYVVVFSYTKWRHYFKVRRFDRKLKSHFRLSSSSCVHYKSVPLTWWWFKWSGDYFYQASNWGLTRGQDWTPCSGMHVYVEFSREQHLVILLIAIQIFIDLSPLEEQLLLGPSREGFVNVLLAAIGNVTLCPFAITNCDSLPRLSRILLVILLLLLLLFLLSCFQSDKQPRSLASDTWKTWLSHHLSQ